MPSHDNRQPAAFRGVPFFVEISGSSANLGRRTVVHQYPYRDTPWVDDLGRRAREFTLRAYLIGHDLDVQRAALIEALEAPGPDILVHPRWGALRVQVGQVRWSTKRSNVETFQIQFLEPGENLQPTQTTDTRAAVKQVVNGALTAVEEGFNERFAFPQKLQFLFDDATNYINRGLNGLHQINGNIQGAIAPVGDIALAIDNIGDEVTQLIRTPATLAADIVSVVNQTVGLSNDVDSALDSYRHIETLWADVDPVPVLSTPARQTQQQNREAVLNLFTQAAIISSTEAIVDQASAVNVTNNADSPFDSFDQAIAVRNELLEQLDIISLTAPDELFEASTALQAAFSAHIEAHGIRLPRIRREAMQQEQPALVTTYRFYGDSQRVEDVITRNALRHPLFISAGKTLELLEVSNG